DEGALPPRDVQPYSRIPRPVEPAQPFRAAAHRAPVAGGIGAADRLRERRQSVARALGCPSKRICYSRGAWGRPGPDYPPTPGGEPLARCRRRSRGPGTQLVAGSRTGAFPAVRSGEPFAGDNARSANSSVLHGRDAVDGPAFWPDARGAELARITGPGA